MIHQFSVVVIVSHFILAHYWW